MGSAQDHISVSVLIQQCQSIACLHLAVRQHVWWAQSMCGDGSGKCPWTLLRVRETCGIRKGHDRRHRIMWDT